MNPEETTDQTAGSVSESEPARRPKRRQSIDLTARGEPFLWALGGSLALGVLMVVGFLVLILWNGVVTFYPQPIHVVTKKDGKRLAGSPFRSESFRPGLVQLANLPEDTKAKIKENQGHAHRTLFRIGNFDLYNEDFRWVPDYEVKSVEIPPEIYFVERLEWGPFIGFIRKASLNGQEVTIDSENLERLHASHEEVRERWETIRDIEHNRIGAVNHYLEKERLALRRALLDYGKDSRGYRDAQAHFNKRRSQLRRTYFSLARDVETLKKEDEKFKVTLTEVDGKEKTIHLSEVVRFFRPNQLSLMGSLGVYFSRWKEFFLDEPREANTEGGVFPALFGTALMTLLLVVFVAPFGVVTALYLREYAKQGRLVSIVRISVNNLAGVPSIVYGVFGLGFFAYTVGATIDQLFFPERLPNPTFGTGGILWASLTLALLTVPVVIVATEEALAAVPRSMREGSLACGASKWQTIRNIVLPQAMPGIMTGLILAMARGAGEVAPLMLVGVVKLAPELPFDSFFPYFHLERSFMHLGFHIYDVGFQSRNSEAGKPMVFVTTLLLIGLIALMNATAIGIRNRLRRKFTGGQF